MEHFKDVSTPELLKCPHDINGLQKYQIRCKPHEWNIKNTDGRCLCMQQVVGKVSMVLGGQESGKVPTYAVTDIVQRVALGKVKTYICLN